MKKTIFSIAIAATLMTGIALTGCQSATQKSEDAQADVKDAKQDLQKEQQDAAMAAQEAANEQEWLAFKSNAEEKIRDNDARIVELKAKMKKSGKTMDAIYAKKIENLEQKNKDLKTKLESYGSTESDWESFKREFNHDMDELGQAFKDLTVDNKN